MTLVKERSLLREVCADDCKTLFCWVNEPLVRRNSLKTDLITWETHKEWFSNKINNPKITRIFILENEASQPVGQIRFDKEAERVVIDYSVDVNFRGQGIGQNLLERGLIHIAQIWTDVECSVGIVKPENVASRRVFEKVGFILEKDDVLLEYKKIL